MSPAQDVPAPAEIDATIASLEPLVEASLAGQQEIVAFRARYDRIGADAPLPPKSLRQIADGRRRWLGLQERLVETARRFAPLVDPGAVSPRDALGRCQALGISLLAALTLYDNYLALLLVIKDDRLRRLLFDEDHGYGIEPGPFWVLVEGLNAPEAQRTLGGLVDAWAQADEALAATDPHSVVLRRAIEASAAYRHARDASLAGRLPTAWGAARTRFLDVLAALGAEALGGLSRLFGDGVGLVELRKGKLWNDPRVHEHLMRVLQPLDLLLEKTPFRLTDYFIPGHFGHVAVWMGTDAELEGLGVWARPAMQVEPLRAYRALVRRERSVLEALRSGVALNTLADFLNVDDVAVLRPTSLQGEQPAESLVRGFRQVGKEYDFNFDIETSGSIVCSELPYHVYPGVPWQTASQLGRFTISPDDVAAQVLGGEFELVVLYHDGVLVDAAEAPARLATLLREG
ncbi:MAG: YiiX/YebB-like N1pC/P60 family cysteine hydrolase [Planctomycetota bacterium]|nr:YiiX/YebB-like N1pC/P60 family cysteine hydrolase [Planctomycetota bacterium]